MTIDREPSALLPPVTDFHLPAVGMLAAPLGLAAIAGAIFIGGIFGWHPLWSQERPTLAEAIVLSDRGAVAQMLRDGADANAKYPVRAGILHSEPRLLTPLEAAVAIRSVDMLEYLQHYASADALARTSVGCFAIRLHTPELLPALGLEAGALDCGHVSYPW